MNWIDLSIILVVLIFAIEGQKRGFLIQIIDGLGFLFSLILGLFFYSEVAQFLIKTFNVPKIAANPIGFLVVWLLTETVFFAIFDTLFKKVLSRYGRNTMDKFLGFIPSIINAGLFLAFVLLFIVSLPIRPDIKKDIFASKIGSVLVERASVLERPFNSIFGPIAKQGLTFLTVKPEEKGSVQLGFTQSQLTHDYESEKVMFDFVNRERAKVGISPVIWDEARAQVGRKHSEDMFKRGYFSHYSPEGKDVGDRLQDVGINYTIAGENLALAPSVERADTGLINSEGHRRNILDPAFKKLGVGAIDGGVYGKMFTQVFTD